MAYEKAFTLIELLIAVAIIGILAAIAVPNFLNAQIRAKVARAYADQKAMDTAIQQYMLDVNDNPPHSHASNQNFWLTTPVAYLSGFLYDPFQDTPLAQELFGSHLQYNKKQYHWDPFDKRYFNGISFSSIDPQKTPEYDRWIQSIGIIFGMGPSLKFTGFPEFTFSLAYVPYECSNGLMSVGIIRRYTPGQPKL